MQFDPVQDTAAVSDRLNSQPSGEVSLYPPHGFAIEIRIVACVADEHWSARPSS